MQRTLQQRWIVVAILGLSGCVSNHLIGTDPDLGGAGGQMDAGGSTGGDGGGGVISGGCACPETVGAGKVCIAGNFIDFSTGARLPAGTKLQVSAYEPLAFVANPSVPPLVSTTVLSSCFAIELPAPGAGLAVLGVSDPPGGGSALGPLALGATAVLVTGNKSYQVDAYVVKKQLVDGWVAASGQPYDTEGAYVGCFYNEPPPSRTSQLFTETQPTAGVKVTADGTVVADARYLAPDRALDVTLTSTGALGCAIITPVSSSIVNFSGKGVVTHWEAHPSGSHAGVVMIDRFHSCDSAAGSTAPTCM
jgi:hypothetical protein